MPKKNQIKWNDFLKATEKLIESKYPKYKIVQKRGSGIRFEVFENEDDDVPIEMWVAHKDKYVGNWDLKKVCERFGITPDEFADSIG